MKNALMLFIATLLLVLIMFSACNRNKSEALLPELIRAESIMYQHPDSALRILEQMPVPPASDRLQNATWCLLMSQAKYKNFMKQPSDSLINIAYDYFKEKNDPQQKAMVLYYKGVLNAELGKTDESLQNYLEAVKYAEQTNDYQLCYLIYIAKGELYLYSDLKDYAMKEILEAYQFAVLSGNKSYVSGSLQYIARTYGLQTEWEKAIEYYEKAEKVARETGNIGILSCMLSELSSACYEMKKWDVALKYAYNALDLRTKEKLETEQTLLIIGNIYRLTGKVDSAYHYLNKAKLSDNIYTTRDAYFSLYQLSRDINNFEKALGYNDKYQLYADSIWGIDRSKAFVEMQEKYNQEKIINERNQLKIENDQVIRNALLEGIFLLIIIALLIYVYQQRLIRKERTIQENKELIRLHTLQIHENEALIARNEIRVGELLVEIEQNQEVQEQVEELQKVIVEIKNTNESLHEDNESLQTDIAHHATVMQEKSKLLDSVKVLSDKVLYLQGREKFLCDQLVMKTDVLNKLKKSPKALDVEKWENIREAIDFLYDRFTVRLKNNFPSLTEGEVKICCLVKLHISVSDMGTILGISPTSVSRSKLRLKEHIIQELGRGLDEDKTLDLWIWEY